MKAAVLDVEIEVSQAKYNYPEPFNSHHEAQAVLEEEVLELRDEMYWGQKKHNNGATHKQHIRNEAKQVAAMALRIMVELA